MSEAAGPQFTGMQRFEARAAVISALEKKGLYRGKAGHASRIALCSRSGDIIEPLLKPQWYGTKRFHCSSYVL